MSEEDFKEHEYKYFSDKIKLSDFKSLMEKLKLKYIFKRFYQPSSWDIYYVKKDSTEEFQRFRNDGREPELTKKVKTKNSNNWERIESDLPLDPNRVTEEKVSFHVGLDNYVENFRIFKVCFIYWFEDVNYVWYSVYDEDMKEIDRFLEIEINKNRLPFISDTVAILKEHESNLLELGVTSQNRTKLSLFERYLKEVK